MSNNLIRQYRVIDSEFNRRNYAFIIGDSFNNPPGYAQVKVYYIDSIVDYERYGENDSYIRRV